MPGMNNEDVTDAAAAKKAIARNEETLSETELDELLAPGRRSRSGARSAA